MWWPWSKPKASPKRVAQLEADVADVALELAWCKKAVKDLNARMATLQRQAKPGVVVGEVGPETEQSADDEPPRHWAPPPSVSTAHLARRFRGG